MTLKEFYNLFKRNVNQDVYFNIYFEKESFNYLDMRDIKECENCIIKEWYIHTGYYSTRIVVILEKEV